MTSSKEEEAIEDKEYDADVECVDVITHTIIEGVSVNASGRTFNFEIWILSEPVTDELVYEVRELFIFIQEVAEFDSTCLLNVVLVRCIRQKGRSGSSKYRSNGYLRLEISINGSSY